MVAADLGRIGAPVPSGGSLRRRAGGPKLHFAVRHPAYVELGM
ncbi:hypothetical protein [Streptomyces sp. NPDC004270]